MFKLTIAKRIKSFYNLFIYRFLITKPVICKVLLIPTEKKKTQSNNNKKQQTILFKYMILYTTEISHIIFSYC